MKMPEEEMPFNLPELKEVEFDINGKRVKALAKPVKAGADDSWAHPETPTVVLHPLGEDLAEKNMVRELLENLKYEKAVREQAIEQLSRDLGRKGLDKTSIIALSPRIRKSRGKN